MCSNRRVTTSREELSLRQGAAESPGEGVGNQQPQDPPGGHDTRKSSGGETLPTQLSQSRRGGGAAVPQGDGEPALSDKTTSNKWSHDGLFRSGPPRASSGARGDEAESSTSLRAEKFARSASIGRDVADQPVQSTCAKTVMARAAAALSAARKAQTVRERQKPASAPADSR